MLFCDHRYVVAYENGIFVSGVFVPNWWNSYGLRNDWFKSSQTNVKSYHNYAVDYENGTLVSGAFVPNWWNS